MSILGGNSWDWILVIMLMVFAIATGLKDDGKTVIPKPLIVRTIILTVLLFLVLNTKTVIKMVTGWGG